MPAIALKSSHGTQAFNLTANKIKHIKLHLKYFGGFLSKMKITKPQILKFFFLMEFSFLLLFGKEPSGSLFSKALSKAVI